MSAFEITIVEKLGRSDLYWRAHKRARHIWARTSNILLAAIAVTGALTGGSAIAERTVAAVILGIASAVLAGTNAGLQPAERAAEHRTASAGYGRIFRSLERVLCDREFGQPLREELLAEFVAVDDEFDKLELEART